MRKISLLEQMRAARESREHEATAQLQDVLHTAQARSDRLAGQLRDMEAFLGSRLAPAIQDKIVAETARMIRQKIIDATMKAGRAGEDLTVAFSHSDLCFSDPKSIEAEVLRRYAREALPKLNFRIGDVQVADASITTFDIHIPSLGYRQVLRNW